MSDIPPQNFRLTRRALVAGLPLLAAGCVTQSGGLTSFGGFGSYGAVADGGVVVPAIDTTSIDPSLLRQEVAWSGPQRPGSIVVMIPERRLYFVEGGGRAMRYA